jgi:large subunit ribosomal protein L19
MQDLQLREGQNVKVVQRVIEGKRDRNVPFTGKILKVKGAGPNKMITVRQILENVAVDRIFPVASPTLVKIEVEEPKKVIETKKRVSKASKPSAPKRSKTANKKK